MGFDVRRAPASIAPFARDLWTAVQKAVGDFARDRGTQSAAAMSYYVLFSIFPLLLVIVAVASLFVSESYVREQAIDWITENVGLTSEGREDIDDLLDRAVAGLGAVGFVGLIALVWSASSMMTSLRHAVNKAWDVETRRHFVRGKALDLVLVFALFVLFVASIGLTFVIRFIDRVSSSVADHNGPFPDVSGALVDGLTRLSPLLISFVSFLLIYRVVPAVQTRFRDVWIGALIAAVLFEAAKLALAVYFANFNDYDEVYGSLGAVISFLFFVWIAAVILLLGAEIAAEWPRVRAGAYDDERASSPDGSSPAASVRSFVRGQAERITARKPKQALAPQESGGRVPTGAEAGEAADEQGGADAEPRAGAGAGPEPTPRPK